MNKLSLSHETLVKQKEKSEVLSEHASEIVELYKTVVDGNGKPMHMADLSMHLGHLIQNAEQMYKTLQQYRHNWVNN